MFLRGLVLLTVAALSANQCAGQDVGQLIERLGSPRYEEREAADRALRAVGKPALEALRKAAGSRDVEVRRRATRLVRQIEKRLDAARLLAPRKVRLTYKGTPVAEAVADFAKKTGFPLKLDDAEKLAGRKVTLDTGETTFWQALDQFCKKARLTRKADRRDSVPPGDDDSSVDIDRDDGEITPRDVTEPEMDNAPAVLTLADGEPPALPTHYAGAIRLRALPPGTLSERVVKDEDEIQLTLEGTTEPHMRWQQAVGLRVHKALDDQGQLLRPRPFVPRPTHRTVSDRRRSVIIINQVPITPRDTEKGDRGQVPVRLAPGDKPSKLLKELTGTVLVQVRSAPETLVVVDDILKAQGKTFKGSRGGSVKVLEVRREKGAARLRVQVVAPPSHIDDRTTGDPSLTVYIDGREVRANNEPLSASNFSLLDDKGRPFRVVRAVSTGVRAGAARELELSYKAETDASRPARFLFTGRRSAVVEVPFTLKDVPLP